MRSLLVLDAWPEVRTPTEAWLAADGEGRPLVLAHGTGHDVPPIAANESRTIHAVLAGRIDNQKELRASLAARHGLTGNDDAELVVHLYEERGLQCVNALRGAFALAVWDARRRLLLIARDQLGLVPLYYSVEGARLAASSSLPPLAALPGLGANWDAAALDTFLTFGAVPPPATPYPAIRQLGPGELLVAEGRRVRVQRYWQPTFPERRLVSAELAGVLRTQVAEALRLRQAGSVTGLLLSGGVDAAILLALARADHRLPTRAITVALDGGDAADLRAAQELAAEAGVDHVLIRDEPDWAAMVDALLGAHGAPIGGLDALVLRLAADRAGDDLDAVLAGLGGDEVLGGSAPTRAAARVAAYRRLPALARESAELWARVGPLRWSAGLRRLVGDERLAPLEMYARAVSVFLPEERAELYTPEFADTLGDARPWEALTELFSSAVSAGATETEDAIHFVELTLGLPARATALRAATGREIRLPLADHRLVQFVASAPPTQRGTARERQLLLQAAVQDLVPPTVLRRAHTSPARAIGFRAGALRDFVAETLAPSRLAAQGVFQPATVGRLWEEHLAGVRDHGPRLWALVLATRWIESHLARSPASIRAAG